MKTGIFIILTTTFCTMFAGAQNTEPATSPWPRAININKEHIKGVLTVYQPQLESMKGDKITARAAFSFKKEGKSDPVFGAMWLNAKVEIDFLMLIAAAGARGETMLSDGDRLEVLTPMQGG